VPEGPRPTLRVEEDGSVAGFSGCNRFHGRFEEGESPGAVSVGPLVSTRMACPPEAMELERTFLASLRGVESYGFHLGRLALDYRDEEGGGRLLFLPGRSGEDAP
jgi:heat shock protein HslJ